MAPRCFLAIASTAPLLNILFATSPIDKITDDDAIDLPSFRTKVTDIDATNLLQHNLQSGGKHVTVVASVNGSASATANVSGTPSDPSCSVHGWKRTPTDMFGQSGSKEANVKSCQARCGGTAGCCYFSYFEDKGCHLHECGTRMVPDKHALTGPVNCTLKDCFQSAKQHVPMDMPGQARTSEDGADACQSRCATTESCCYFSFWTDGGCHLQACNATETAGRWDVISGPRTCDALAAPPVSGMVPKDIGCVTETNGACSFPFDYNNHRFWTCSDWGTAAPRTCGTNLSNGGCMYPDACLKAVAQALKPRRAVSRLYTFAAPPATKNYQLTDGWTADGAFVGLRTYSRSPDGVVDMVAKSALNYAHPLVPSMEIRIEQQVFRGNPFSTVALHRTDLYNGTAQQWAASAATMWRPYDVNGCAGPVCHVHYYYFNYSAVGHPMLTDYHRFCMEAELAWPTNVSGYTLMGSVAIPAPGHYNVALKHRVHLYQETSTKKCVLTFATGDSISNLDAAPITFCGFDGVHKGLAWELRNLVSHTDFQNNIKTKFGDCSTVDVTGHSKGGGLANLFAACVNRRMAPTDGTLNDYAMMLWEGPATQPPPLLSGGAAAGVSSVNGCLTQGNVREPADLLGMSRTQEDNVTMCHARCAYAKACCYFTFWGGDGGCHLQDCGARLVPSTDNVSTGPVRCNQVDCFETAKEYLPRDMPGHERTLETSASTCQEHCQLTAGCCHFSFWSDGGCHLHACNATPTVGNWDTISGPRQCGSR